MEYHVPVLLKESIEGLNIKPNGIYVDLTFGGGGHSKAILNKLRDGRLIVFDQDEDAKKNIINDERFLFINSNFKFFQNFLKYYKIGKVDGILADLGVSSHHFDVAQRGFSFRFNGNLDMRMDKNSDKTASDIVNRYSSEDLMKIFSQYGEIKNAYRLVKVIVREREKCKINTIEAFKDAIKEVLPKFNDNKYLAKVFQALRIEVNNELKTLEEALLQTETALNTGGRLVVITYHSLEDRIVKNYIKAGNMKGEIKKDFYGNPLSPFKLVNRKVIIPNQNELNVNSRARSAKLRIAEKIEIQ